MPLWTNIGRGEGTIRLPIHSDQRKKDPDMKKVPPIPRPRWTWRYFLCLVVVTYVTYRWLFSMPLFAHPLPQYTGPYPVGAIDIEVPVGKPRVIHDARLKETGGHAFRLETVLFTIYYPTTVVKSVHAEHHWIPKPLSLTAEGYARFAHVNNYVTNAILTGAMGALVGGITIPAKVDVPLATSPIHRQQSHLDLEKVVTNAEPYPVIIFSHGMASSRTDYTHYLGELASRGYVVAAIEHRDGSSPGSLVCHHHHRRDGSNKSRNRHASYIHDHHHHKSQSRCKAVLHFSLGDTDNQDMDTTRFKEAQLRFRQAEIDETVSVLKQINAGHGGTIYALNSRHEGHDLANWAGRLDTDAMVMAGHSYGATGALRSLRSSSSSSSFAAAIVLDPGKHSGPLNAEIDVPTLIVHSNSWSATTSIFTGGRPHFDVVRDLARSLNDRGVPAWFLTSLGTSHPSVTDAPLIEPLLLSWTTGADVDVVEAVRQYVHVSHDFLTFVRKGVRRNLLEQEAVYPDYGVDNRRTDERFRRYWQIHVAPPAMES